ncbi:unnamed protein product, partial [Candidula unifasciata]
HYDQDNGTNETADFLYGNHREHHVEPVFLACLWFIAIYTGLSMVKEIAQIASQ